MEGLAVQLWTVGDDALSLNFAEQLEAALFAEGGFVRFSGDGPAPLQVSVTSNLAPDGRGRISVSYAFSIRGRATGGFMANCPEVQLDRCVMRIVRHAQKAFRP